MWGTKEDIQSHGCFFPNRELAKLWSNYYAFRAVSDLTPAQFSVMKMYYSFVNCHALYLCPVISLPQLTPFPTSFQLLPLQVKPGWPRNFPDSPGAGKTWRSPPAFQGWRGWGRTQHSSTSPKQSSRKTPDPLKLPSPRLTALRLRGGPTTSAGQSGWWPVSANASLVQLQHVFGRSGATTADMS